MLPANGRARHVPTLAPPPPPRPRVLVVDDEPLMRAVCARLLEPEFLAWTAADAAEALAYFEGGARFDAVLCDMTLPGMNGLALRDAVARRAPDQARRFVFVSGRPCPPERDELAGRWLVKPVDWAALRASLRAAARGPGALAAAG